VVVDGVDLRSRDIGWQPSFEASALDLCAQLCSSVRERRQVEFVEARGKPPEAPLDLSGRAESAR